MTAVLYAGARAEAAAAYLAWNWPASEPWVRIADGVWATTPDPSSLDRLIPPGPLQASDQQLIAMAEWWIGSDGLDDILATRGRQLP